MSQPGELERIPAPVSPLNSENDLDSREGVFFKPQDGASSKDPNGHGFISGVAYRPDTALEKSSLSMRLMHRPSRAQNEFIKASDPTRQNSLLNSFVPRDREINSLSPPESQPSEEGSPSDLIREATPTRLTLVRKKSGEIVKSLLKDKASSISIRSRSLPSTPTYKQVHFGGDNDVRYFKKKDRPAAISASNSPRQNDDDDDDEGEIPSLQFEFEGDVPVAPLFDPNRKSYFEYYDDELNSHVDHTSRKSSKTPSAYDWQLHLTNFSPQMDPLASIKRGKQVFLENVFLSVDKRYLLGQVAVLNIAFEKWVIVRYSLDNWRTIVEIKAVYLPDCPMVLKSHNYDRFMFKIPLDSFVNGFHSSTEDPLANTSELFADLCVKYHVNGEELWDNNDGNNYAFTLKKDIRPKMRQKEIPSSARTKQETHKKRPKYSSSYLKRIKSDSSLPKELATLSLDDSSRPSSKSTNPTSPDGAPDAMNLCAGTNDFERNNYYLSSPMFSSFAGKGTVHDIEQERPVSPNSASFEEKKDKGDNAPSRHFRPEADPESFPRITTNLHEPMSYKDFLDSYCFFNSKVHDNSSKTTLVMSDGPASVHNDTIANPEVPSSDPVYSVSSFLT